MTLFHPSGVVSNIMDIFLQRWRNGVTKICNTCYNHHYHTVHFPILFHATCQPSCTLWIYLLVTVIRAANTLSSKSGSRLVGNNIHHYAQKVCWAPSLIFNLFRDNTIQQSHVYPGIFLLLHGCTSLALHS